MPARSSAASGAQTGLLAMPSQSTRGKVSPLQTRTRSGLSMITFSERIKPTWPYQEWSISASSSVWYAPPPPPEEGSVANRFAACNIELLWAYQPKDTQQFSIDRLDNTMGHIRDNIWLTCLECNRKRGYAVLSA